MTELTIWDGRYEIPVTTATAPGALMFGYSGGGNLGYAMSTVDIALSVNRFALSFQSSDFATFPTGKCTVLVDRSETSAAHLATLTYSGSCTFTHDRFYVGAEVHDLDGNHLYTSAFPPGARVVGDRAVYFDMPGSTWIAHVYDARTGREIGQCDTGAPYGAAGSHCGFALSGNRLTVLPSGYNKAVVIDTDSMSVFATVNVGTTEASGHTSEVVNRVAASGNLAAVVNTGSNSVTVINTSTGTVVRTIAVGTQPLGICVYRGVAAVANSGSSSVSLINISTGATVRTFNVQSTQAYFVAFHGVELVVTLYSAVGRAYAYGYASGQTASLTPAIWNGVAESPISSLAVA